MLLAARSVDSAKALIDRGIAADQQLGKRGVPLAYAVFVNTQDKARNVRAPLFPPPMQISGLRRFPAGFAPVLPTVLTGGFSPRTPVRNPSAATTPPNESNNRKSK